MFREARLVFRLILDEWSAPCFRSICRSPVEYAGLVEDESVREPIFSRIAEEYRLTCEMILRIPATRALPSASRNFGGVSRAA